MEETDSRRYWNIYSFKKWSILRSKNNWEPQCRSLWSVQEAVTALKTPSTTKRIRQKELKVVRNKLMEERKEQIGNYDSLENILYLVLEKVNIMQEFPWWQNGWLEYAVEDYCVINVSYLGRLEN